MSDLPEGRRLEDQPEQREPTGGTFGGNFDLQMVATPSYTMSYDSR